MRKVIVKLIATTSVELELEREFLIPDECVNDADVKLHCMREGYNLDGAAFSEVDNSGTWDVINAYIIEDKDRDEAELRLASQSYLTKIGE